MNKNPISSAVAVNPSIISFKPRQVLLATTSKMKQNEKKNNHKDDVKSAVRTLKSEEKALLLKCVAGYLKSNGFSKTLKKFLAQAEIEKDHLSDSSPKLEVVFCKYLETCELDDTKVSTEKVQDSKKDENSKREKEADAVNGAETVGKKKKKKTDERSVDSTEPEKKEKKKSKKNKDSLGQKEEVAEDIAKESADNEPEKKPKDRKKKKIKLESETKNDDDNKTLEEDAKENETKASKKRKRSIAEENNPQPIDKEVEESKRQKMEGLEEKEPKAGATKENKGQNGQDVKVQSNGEKSASGKTPKKRENGSAETSSGKAFQRVKVEEVEFTDDRLRDNSYWAKDGAETGYGAKAQEVLGQVRGRDFRHEKTKKKRGSYKGGFIDLHSHSVKFNYSDEE